MNDGLLVILLLIIRGPFIVISENSLVCHVLYLHTNWNCSGICLWWTCKVGNHFIGNTHSGESLLMLPFAVLGFVMKPLQLKGFAPESKKALLSIETAASGTEDSDLSHIDDEVYSSQASVKVSKFKVAPQMLNQVT